SAVSRSCLHVVDAQVTAPSGARCHPDNGWPAPRHARCEHVQGRSSGAWCVYTFMVNNTDDEDDNPNLVPTPPATLQALAEQDTDELRNEARRFAESRLRYVRGAGHPIPKNYADELVSD